MSKTLHSKMLKLGKFGKKRYILLSINLAKWLVFVLLPQLHMSWSPIRGD